MEITRYLSYQWPEINPVLIVLEDLVAGEITRCQLLTFPVGKMVSGVIASFKEAQRSPADVYDAYTGARKARNRALRDALSFWEARGEVQSGTWDRLFHTKKRPQRAYRVNSTGWVYAGNATRRPTLFQPRWEGLEQTYRLIRLARHAIHEGATVDALKRFRTYVSLHREGKDWFITTVKCQADQYGEPDAFEENTFPIEKGEAPDVFLRTYQSL